MNRKSTKFRAFTLIELLVVIVIIGVLAALLLPIYGSVQRRSQTTVCASNLKQIGAAMLAYASDNNGQLPPLAPSSASGNSLWWFDYLGGTVGGVKYLPEPNFYIHSQALANNNSPVWHCPAVPLADELYSGGVQWGQGYGVNMKWGNHGIFETADKTDYSGQGGSKRLSLISNPSQKWLVGDAGSPKTGTLPQCGYHTWITVTSPASIGGTAQYQPSCIHNLMANVCFCDGHVETWTYTDLANNKNDIFN